MFVRRPIGVRNQTKYCIKLKYNERRSLMFWDFICADGRRDIVCCEDTMESVKYCSYLQNIFVTKYMNKILQKDNASCHCSKFTSSFHKSHKIDVLPNYPACSPDLNIIENIWAILKDSVRRHDARNLSELRTFVKEEFHKIAYTIIVSLKAFQSVSQRFFAEKVSNLLNNIALIFIYLLI